MEERQIERIKKKLIVKVEDQNCIIEDISKVGMRLVIPFLLKVHDVNVTFQLEDISLELKCHICWIKKEVSIYQQPQYQVGLYIPDPPEEYIRLVEELMSQ